MSSIDFVILGIVFDDFLLKNWHSLKFSLLVKADRMEE